VESAPGSAPVAALVSVPAPQCLVAENLPGGMRAVAVNGVDHALPWSPPASAPRGWVRRWGHEAPGLLVVAGVVAAVFWPLFTMRALLISGEVGTSDAIYQTYPFRLILGRALAAGHLPFWTGDIYCGFPLLANPSVGTLYPLNWLYAALPAASAASVVLLLSCLMAGCFTYAYVRTLGLGRAPATLAGMSFGACGFFVCHAKHAAFINTASWLPLHLALVERARAGGPRGLRAALWLAPVTALAGLAGGVQVLYLGLLLLAIYAPARLLAADAAGPRRRRLVLLGAMALAVALGLLMTAPQLLPSLELTSTSERQRGITYASADRWPLPLHDLLTLGWAGAVGLPGDGSYRGRDPEGYGIFWEDYGYVGWPVALLALTAACLLARRSALCRLLLILAGAGAVLALGVQTGLFWAAFHALPGLSYFRFPQRFLLWTELCTAVLGAWGLALVLGRLPGRRRAALAAVILLVAAVDLGSNQGRVNVYYDRQAWQQPPASALAVRAGTRQGSGRVGTAAPVLSYRLCVEHGGLAGNRHRFWRERGLLQPDGNVLWAVPQVGGYVELIPRWLELRDVGIGSLEGLMTLGAKDLPQHEAVLRPPTAYMRLLEACNAHYLLCGWPLEGEGLQLAASDGTVWVYHLPQPLGRAYLVPQAADIGTDGNFLARSRLGLDFARTVYLLGKSGQPAVGFQPSPVRLQESADQTHLSLAFTAPTRGWLVLTDTYYPGWQATIDGRPVVIERANCWMRAVQVPAGRHLVHFRYRCRPYERGLRIAAGSALVWLACMLFLPAGLRRRWA